MRVLLRKILRKDIANSWKFLFNKNEPHYVHTEKILWDMANFCNANKSTMYFAQDAGPYMSAYEEGKRAVWLWLSAKIDMDALEAAQMRNKFTLQDGEPNND